MEYRVLDINVLTSNDLENPNLISKMDAYVVVSLSGDPRLGHQMFKTNVDRDGSTNPSWNFPIKFRMDESAAKQNRLSLTFTIRCDRVLGDKDAGTVVVPLKELYDGADDTDGGKTTTQMKSVTYQVRKPSGKPKGALQFSYKFGETEKYPYADAAPMAAVTAVPIAYPAGTSAAYPPPPPPAYAYPAQQYPGYGFGGYPPPPPQPGYGYPPPPPPAGFGYPQQQQQQPRNRNNMGLGLGAGLLGGVLGGLLIGDLVSDAGDAGFDGGFGDGFGF